MKDITVRPIRPEEIDKVACLISTGYYDDIFFKWTVERDEDRYKVVTDYYKAYLHAKGCVAHVAETSSAEIIGASVWLPHDVDESIYDEIDIAAGSYASRFRAVADNSHYSEPPMEPFYQLVGIVVNKEAQGLGVGAKLLKYQLDQLDTLGIPTYLEASTPYNGKGIYGKFGYQPVGELMVFSDTAVLYPLWRPANKKQQVVDFGGYSWQVLERYDDSLLLLSENVIEAGKYHEVYENVTWSSSAIREYLNGSFYDGFTSLEKSQILEAEVMNNDNPWFGTNGGPVVTDKIFLLSIEEVIKYLGDSGELKNSGNKYFIDDSFNNARKATLTDNSPSRWFLRTPGNSSDFVSVVTMEGKIAVTGDFVNRSSSELFKVGIRPAVWVKREREEL